MIIGILRNVNSVNLNRVANSVTSARLHTGRLKATQQKKKKTKKDGDKGAVAILKDARQLGCVFQDTAAGILTDFPEEPKNRGTKLTRAIHKICAASCKHPGKTKVHR